MSITINSTDLAGALKELVAVADAGALSSGGVVHPQAQYDSPDANGAVAFTNLPPASGGNGKRWIFDQIVKTAAPGSRVQLFGVPNLDRADAELLLASLNLIECADVVVHHDNFGNTVSNINTHPFTPVTGTFAVPRKFGSAQDVYNLLAAWNP
jgi:threonine dehydrogenase-like Zn-dependent dehydrogenase